MLTLEDMNVSMKPEFELLVRACGVSRGLPVFGPTSQSDFPAGFDQKGFMAMAIQHKVAATAYAGIKKLGLEAALTPETRTGLKLHAAQGQFLRAQIAQEAGKIGTALISHGMPAVVIKGPASSLQLYGDPLVREFDDLDILVNVPEIEPLVPTMAQLGWVLKEQFLQESPKYKKSKFIQHTHHATFWNETRNFRVEIHDRTGWEGELLHRDNIDAVFARSILLHYEKCDMQLEIPALAPSDQALLTMSHGVQHAWCLLHWLLDAARILDNYSDEEAEALLARAHALDMEAQLLLAVDVAQRLYPLNYGSAFARFVMAHNSQSSASAALQKSADFALARIERGGTDMNSMHNIIYFSTAYSFPLLHSPTQKLKSAIAAFKIPTKDLEAVPLPRQLLFLH